jgi:hypothetical protein
MNATRPIGAQRGIAFVVILSIFTLGIYFLYWSYKSFDELKKWRGEGVNGLVGMLLSLIIVGIFLLPSYVGRMYKEASSDRIPMTGWTGLFALIPYVGGIIWQIKVQGALNEFWARQSQSAPAAGTAAVTT